MSEISKEDMHMIRERLDAVRDMFRHGQLMMDNVAEYAALNDVPALLAHIDALEAERNRLQQAVNEAWDITSKPISSEVEMHPRITQIMDALQDALSKPTLDKYNVKLD